MALAYLSHTLVAPSPYPALLQYCFVSHRDPFFDHLQAGGSLRVEGLEGLVSEVELRL